jgi:hypothetical protein
MMSVGKDGRFNRALEQGLRGLAQVAARGAGVKRSTIPALENATPPGLWMHAYTP